MCESVCVVRVGDRGSRAGGFAALVATPLEAAEEGRRARWRPGRSGKVGRAGLRGRGGPVLGGELWGVVWDGEAGTGSVPSWEWAAAAGRCARTGGGATTAAERAQDAREQTRFRGAGPCEGVRVARGRAENRWSPGASGPSAAPGLGPQRGPSSPRG